MAALRLWGLLGFLVLPGLLAADAAESLGFGRELLRQRDPYRAVTEFQRARYQSKDPAVHARAEWLLVVAYAQGERWQQVLDQLQSLGARAQDPGLAARVRAHAALLGGLTPQEAHWDGLSGSGNAALRHRWAGAALDAARRRDWADCSRRLADRPDAELSSAQLVAVEAALDISRRAQRRFAPQPWAAGLASALVPGSGQALAGRPGDGLYALAWPLALGALAVSLHQSGQAAPGNAAAGLAGAFYLGNIQGGINAAHRTRRVQPQRDEEGIRELLAPIIQGAMLELLAPAYQEAP